jgi:hypothetical protein
MGLVFLLLAWLVPVIVPGALAAGLHLVFLKRMRGRPAGLEEMFRGFDYFAPMLLLTVLSLLLILPAIVIAFAAWMLLSVSLIGAKTMLVVLSAAVWIVGMGLLALTMTAYHFACLFIVDRKMACIPALKTARNVIVRNVAGYLRLGAVLLCCMIAPILTFGFAVVVIGASGLFGRTGMGLEFAAMFVVFTSFCASVPLVFATLTAAYREVIGFAPEQITQADPPLAESAATAAS